MRSGPTNGQFSSELPFFEIRIFHFRAIRHFSKRSHMGLYNDIFADLKRLRLDIILKVSHNAIEIGIR